MSSTNGRPEPEVIVAFADGLSFSKNKLEAFLRSGILDENPTKPPPANVKKEDVDLIVQQLEIPKTLAEKSLVEHGDVVQALRALIRPPP